MLILAFATAAPAGSVTVPRMVPCCPTAHKENPNSGASRRSLNRGMTRIRANVRGLILDVTAKREFLMQLICFSPGADFDCSDRAVVVSPRVPPMLFHCHNRFSHFPHDHCLLCTIPKTKVMPCVLTCNSFAAFELRAKAESFSMPYVAVDCKERRSVAVSVQAA